MIVRRPTRQVTLGDTAHGFVKIGGDAPVSVQSMTAGYTHDIDACVAEINKLARAWSSAPTLSGGKVVWAVLPLP